MKNRIELMACLSLLLIGLAACSGGGGGGGGGGGDGDSPGSFTMSIESDLKQLRFDWTEAEGATYYRLLENPDGVSGFTQVGGELTVLAAAMDIAVHRHDWANARYRVEACNTAGCTASNEVNTVGAMLQAIGYVKASNTGAGDLFGYAVALSADGNTLAVGAYSEDSAATGIDGDQADNTANTSGAVYLFIRDSGGAWSQQAYVKASNTGSDDGFGYAVALSADGNTLAVGASYEDSAATGIDGNQADNTTASAGAVYLFTRDSGAAWSQQAYVKASNTGADDFFGLAVALSADGNTLAVGAQGEDSAATGIDGNQADNTIASAGAVYLFTRASGGAWSQQAYVKASNTGAGDGFGWSGSVTLSADGNTLAVGAVFEDSAATGINGNQADNSATDAGAVYFFTRDSGAAWSQQAYVKASNTGAGDLFGYAVSLSADGSTLAVGAYDETSAATGINGDQADNTADISGAVYLY